MKINMTWLCAVPAISIAATIASAHAGDADSFLQWGNESRPLNHFRLSYRPGFNITAGFKNLGGFAAQSNPGAATNGIDHFYDNGYNRVDTNNNAGGVTAFWGYQSAGQISGNNITMSSSSSPAGASSDGLNGDPQHGLELIYDRELGHNERCSWGVEGAVGYASVTIRDNRSLMGTVNTTTDSYSLLGISPPTPPPYNGPFGAGSGAPVISDSPARTQSTTSSGAGAATITGERSLDANVLSLRLGPYIEAPLCKHVRFTLSGGLALMGVNSDFKFQESVTIAGVGTQTTTGSGNHSDLLVGGYVAGEFTYSFAKSWDVFAGAQYLNVGRYTQSQSGRQAQIDFGTSVFMTVGFGFSF